METVKLISGWSNPGGSTIHHIKLTNLLNENGYDCTFYGPHDWHLDKCKSGKLDESVINGLKNTDILISHFFPYKITGPKVHILSCHESDIYPLKQIDHSHYTAIQFVSNRQKKYHSVNHPSVIIPPLVDKLLWKSPKTNTAGVIGSIDPHKQTHISIQQALTDGYDKVMLFGNVTNKPYYEKFIVPLLSEKVTIPKHCDDKEKMYANVDAVFHNSKFETYGLVEAECKLNGIPFFGPKNDPEILDRAEILVRWHKLLSI